MATARAICNCVDPSLGAIFLDIVFPCRYAVAIAGLRSSMSWIDREAL